MKIIPNSRPRVKGREEFDRTVPLMEGLASHLRPKNALVEVNLVGERRMAALNRMYRGMRGAPEVLTFPYTGDPDIGRDAESPLGEIFLCWPRIAIGAGRRRVTREAYAVRLLVHGLYHLKGYGHECERCELAMEKMERELLGLHLSGEVMKRLFE